MEPFTRRSFLADVGRGMLSAGLGAGLALELKEILTTERLPLTTAIAMIRAGEINDAKTICGLLLAASRTTPQTAS